MSEPQKNIQEHTRSSAGEDPMWEAWLQKAPEIYDKVYYQSNPLVAYINSYGHKAAELKFNEDTHFSRVLEIGAGTGEHLKFVKHSYDEYVITDIDIDLLKVAEQKLGKSETIKFEVQNALALDYPDNSFDRLISIYNLEHLPEPHKALREWRRVVRPGGTITISIPTEGGVAWNLGRYLTTRRQFKSLGLDLDYIISREHVNACYRLVCFIKYYFPERKDNWFPSKIPSTHINLVFTTSVTNNKVSNNKVS